MTDTPDGIWIINSDASTLYASAAMCEILPVNTADLIGKPSFDYIFPEDVEAAQRLSESKQRGDLPLFGSAFAARMAPRCGPKYKAHRSAMWRVNLSEL
jgi:PAS domain S-box-containing protein